MIKAVIFDLDNTLIDFMKIKKASVDAGVSEMISKGLKMSKEEATKALYSLYDKYGIEYQEIFQEFLKEVHKKVDYRILVAGIVAYRRVQARLLEPYPNVIPTLTSLKDKGLRLAILTDAPRLKGWIRLYELNIADFFEVVITYEDTMEYKPSKVPFERVLKELGVRADECIMVGDSVKRDIAGAKNSGLVSVFAKYGATKDVESSGADFEIRSFDELVGIVDGFHRTKLSYSKGN